MIKFLIILFIAVFVVGMFILAWSLSEHAYYTDVDLRHRRGEWVNRPFCLECHKELFYSDRMNQVCGNCGNWKWDTMVCRWEGRKKKGKWVFK